VVLFDDRVVDRVARKNGRDEAKQAPTEAGVEGNGEQGPLLPELAQDKIPARAQV
jgi:hypothetical protein